MLPHTPHDGSSPPFTIGLVSTEECDWIEVDARLEEYLLEKQRLWREVPHQVFVAEAGSEPAQEEVLELLVAHLPRRFPHTHRLLDGDRMLAGPCMVDLADRAVPALRRAANLVQEDLIVMRRCRSGWRLAAGSLSFPSSWHLSEKFGQAMAQIHSKVPGFGEASRNMALIQRMFDSLRPQHIFVRFNWGIYDGPDLFHPAQGNGIRKFGADDGVGQAHLRVERQTVRRMPRTGEILFTIRTYVDPLEALRRQPGGRELALSMFEQIGDLTPEQIAYKGLSQERERLLAWLKSVGNQ